MENQEEIIHKLNWLVKLAQTNKDQIALLFRPEARNTKICCNVPDCLYSIEELPDRGIDKPDLFVCNRETIEINEDGICIENN